MQLQQILAFVAALATISAMAGTVIHIILYKRDVRAAIGWIGLVCFAPLVGIALYWVFGINRIWRRAKKVFAGVHQVELPFTDASINPEALPQIFESKSEHLVELARISQKVTYMPLMQGNMVSPLVNGDQAYPKMLEALNRASKSVSLITYIFDNDIWGRRFRQAMKDAVKRGVEVRVLIDDIGARYTFPSIVKGLRRDKINVQRFMRSLKPWRFRYYNLRNHRKIMIVDGMSGFTGGMNIRAGHVIGDDPRHPIQDLHFQVEGPVVAEMQRAFADDWKFTTGEELIGENWFPELKFRGETVVRSISDGPDEDYDKLRTIILGGLACAHRSIKIVSPYFLPDQELTANLRIASLRGLQVEILQPEQNNLKMVQWAARAGYEDLLNAGCRIFCTPPPFDHSKVMVIDSCWVLLGSANWDPRSLSLNFEFNLEAYNHKLAYSVENIINQKKETARELMISELHGRTLPIRLRDSIFRLASPYL